MTQKYLFHLHAFDNIPGDVKHDSITNIDSYIDASIDHIMITDLLDFYEEKHIPNIIHLLKNKLNRNGSLEIQGPDLSELCIASASSQIDINTVKHILLDRKSIHTIYDIENMLNHFGFKVQQKKYINIFEYYLLVIKNEV